MKTASKASLRLGLLLIIAILTGVGSLPGQNGYGFYGVMDRAQFKSPFQLPNGVVVDATNFESFVTGEEASIRKAQPIRITLMPGALSSDLFVMLDLLARIGVKDVVLDDVRVAGTNSVGISLPLNLVRPTSTPGPLPP